MTDPLPAPGVLDRSTAGSFLAEVERVLRTGPDELVLDLGPVRRADTFGAAALLEARREARQQGVDLRFENVSGDLRRLLAFLRVDLVVRADVEPPRRERLLARIGGWGIDLAGNAVQQASLSIDTLWRVFGAPLHRKGPRWSEFVRQLSAIGAGSMAIVALISGLLGLIMALQAAYQLRQFGANLYVANLVGVAMTRELGPLITAIILAARSGSAMAAELGTMVVTEEVDALRVMAIDPLQHLVAPRFAALAAAMPGLAILADFAGILGGFAVATFVLEIGVVPYYHQTVNAIFLQDVLTGLFKSLVFAHVIAVVSCQAGLSIRGGPESVGRATTKAVVVSIIVVILTDFVFTSFFFAVE